VAGVRGRSTLASPRRTGAHVLRRPERYAQPGNYGGLRAPVAQVYTGLVGALLAREEGGIQGIPRSQRALARKQTVTPAAQTGPIPAYIGIIVLSIAFLASVGFGTANYFDLQKSRQRWSDLYLALETHINSDKANDKAPPPRLEEVKTSLYELIPVLPTKEAESAFEQIKILCTKDTVGRWCLEMLTRLPELKPDSFWIPYVLATEWMQQGRDGADRALKLLKQAEDNVSRVEENQQQELKAWAGFHPRFDA
jgi:hypothetical protein